MTERRTNSEIPLPTSKLILIDLDKTLLVGGSYEINDDRIYAEITRVQSLGWQIGLSSDTALEPLLVWKKIFGMNGPTIAEKGAVIQLTEGREFGMQEALSFFSELKNNFSKYLIDNKIPYLFGDVTQFLRNKPVLKDMVEQRLVLLQAYRRSSLNFYGRVIDDNGILQIDNNLTSTLVDITRKFVGGQPPFEMNEDFNPEYGIYILAPKLVNKRFGTLALIKKLGIEKVGMIGDSSSDILGKDISFHYAVGNAQEALKSISDYSAVQEYTHGVVEILSQIK